jgi:hypothetical protein
VIETSKLVLSGDFPATPRAANSEGRRDRPSPLFPPALLDLPLFHPFSLPGGVQQLLEALGAGAGQDQRPEELPLRSASVSPPAHPRGVVRSEVEGTAREVPIASFSARLEWSGRNELFFQVFSSGVGHSRPARTSSRLITRSYPRPLHRPHPVSFRPFRPRPRPTPARTRLTRTRCRCRRRRRRACLLPLGRLYRSPPPPPPRIPSRRITFSTAQARRWYSNASSEKPPSTT